VISSSSIGGTIGGGIGSDGDGDAREDSSVSGGGGINGAGGELVFDETDAKTLPLWRKQQPHQMQQQDTKITQRQQQQQQ